LPTTSAPLPARWTHSATWRRHTKTTSTRRRLSPPRQRRRHPRDVARPVTVPGLITSPLGAHQTRTFLSLISSWGENDDSRGEGREDKINARNFLADKRGAHGCGRAFARSTKELDFGCESSFCSSSIESGTLAPASLLFATSMLRPLRKFRQSFKRLAQKYLVASIISAYGERGTAIFGAARSPDFRFPRRISDPELSL
jgi:hypothetical protein